MILEEMDLRELAAIADVAAIPRLCEIIAHRGSSRAFQVVFVERSRLMTWPEWNRGG